LLGVAELTDTGIEQRVHPAMLPKDTAIAEVAGVTNAVAIDADFAGNLLLVGAGAGAKPTASAVASDIATIVQNIRQFAVTQELVDKGTQDYQTAVALRQAIAIISTSLEKDVVVERLLLALGNVVTYNNAFVFLWQDNTLKYGASRDFYDRPIRLTPAQTEAIWRDALLIKEIHSKREIIRIDDVREDERWQPYPEGSKIRSWMATPLLSGGELQGILVFDSHEVDAFNGRAEWLASTLASHAAVAIQNASLYQQTQQQLTELGTLYQASATMTANLDQDFVLQTVVSEMVRALQVDSCTIFVWEKDQQSLHPAAHKNQFHADDQPESSHQLGLSQIDNLESYSIVQRVLDTQELSSLRIDEAWTEEDITLLREAKTAFSAACAAGQTQQCFWLVSSRRNDQTAQL
ncbi:MAG: GAF domain-containing protein, partial [Anaerolineae bacterium]|nr:GAF domain-containing protein [Anaerolineae bacterium]